MNLYDRWFSESRESKELLGIFTDREESHRFSVGSVISFSDEWVLLATYDQVGGFDGYQLERISSIFLLERKTRYIAMLQERSKGELALLPSSWMSCRPTLAGLRETVPNGRLFCKIRVEDAGDYVGFILTEEDEGVIFDRFDDEALACDGQFAVRWDLVNRITVESQQLTAWTNSMGRIY